MTGSDVTAGYIVTDIERLRRPMQAISDFLFRAMGATRTERRAAVGSGQRKCRTLSRLRLGSSGYRRSW
jgi:hypothetical protein